MARSIPKRLLIHSVNYEEYVGDDRYGETWAKPIEIKFVRVEPSRKVTSNANGEDIVAQSLIFIDAKHSKPFVKMEKGSKVTFNGVETFVNKVDPLYAFGPNIHHYEIEVV
ncbi:putative minor capsid protein [Paenisporosarcina sp. TG-14]|uniref:putative minor capsid protein n=1 Tax=Paenisporosarcina sp. TG-14 TaxID=1231057 RepID=UPI000360E669|nr:putative minor capsid protein [Paenisporosarcina sp. TG-14]